MYICGMDNKKAGRPKISYTEPIETKCMHIPASKVKAFYRLAKSARKKAEVKPIILERFPADDEQPNIE